MSRADQASEPSMEDILASIRRIIADEEPSPEGEAKPNEFRSSAGAGRDTQRGAPSFPPEPGPRPGGSLSAFSGRPAPRPERPRLSGFSAAVQPTPKPAAPPPPKPQAPRSNPPAQTRSEPVSPPAAAAPPAPADQPADDVLELTDELILLHPDDAADPQAEAAQALGADRPEPAGVAPAPESAAAEETAERTNGARSAEPARVAPALTAAADRAPSQDAGFPFAPQPEARPLWSRRDAGADPANAAKVHSLSRAGAAPRAGQEQPVRWPGDFQAQIPMDGPRAPFGDMQELDAGDLAPGPSDAIEEQVGEIARVAVTGLRDEELVEAQQVNFTSLDAGHRDAVAQTFMRAVAGRHGADSGSMASDDIWTGEAELPEDDFAAAPAPGPVPPSEVAPRGPAQHDHAPAPLTAAAPAPAMARMQPQAQTPPQPVATATFAPPAPAHPAGRPLTFEESVREMLRPMLAEWLNQNMPRILEDAIRAEIKARGLPWDSSNRS